MEGAPCAISRFVKKTLPFVYRWTRYETPLQTRYTTHSTQPSTFPPYHQCNPRYLLQETQRAGLRSDRGKTPATVNSPPLPTALHVSEKWTWKCKSFSWGGGAAINTEG